VTAGESPVTLVQASCRPFANLSSRLESDRGTGLADDENLEHAILDEQLGKAIGVLAVVRIRVSSDHFVDGELLFDAHRR